MDQTIPRLESYRWANIDPLTGKKIDPTAHTTARLLQATRRTKDQVRAEKEGIVTGVPSSPRGTHMKKATNTVSSGELAARAVVARRNTLNEQQQALISDNNSNGDEGGRPAMFLEDMEGRKIVSSTIKNGPPQLLPYSLKPNLNTKFANAAEPERSFFRSVVPTLPATPRSATAIRAPRPPTAPGSSVGASGGVGEGNSSCVSARRTTTTTRAGEKTGKIRGATQAPLGEKGTTPPPLASLTRPATADTATVNAGERPSSTPSGAGGKQKKRPPLPNSSEDKSSGFQTAMYVVSHSSEKAKVEALEKRIFDNRMSPRRQQLLQKQEEEVLQDQSLDFHQKAVQEEKAAAASKKKNGCERATSRPSLDRGTPLWRPAAPGSAATGRSGGGGGGDGRVKSARSATNTTIVHSSNLSTTGGPSSSSLDGTALTTRDLKRSLAALGEDANKGKEFSSLQFGLYRYGKPPSILDDTKPMPLHRLEDMEAWSRYESKESKRRTEVRQETLKELDRFDKVIETRGTGIGGQGGQGKVFNDDTMVTSPLGGTNKPTAADEGKGGSSSIGPLSLANTTTDIGASNSELRLPEPSLFDGSVPPPSTQSPSSPKSVVVVAGPNNNNKPQQTHGSPLMADESEYFPGEEEEQLLSNQNAEVVNKDYQLIRMLFQIELMDNTKANQVLRSIGEETIISRLSLVKNRFGNKRLNKDEFHHALEDLIGVGTMHQSDSDIFFDMFDTNQSGGIDESEFLAGIRMALRDQNKSLAAYCRRLMDARQSVGSVITMMEIELLLHAVGEVAEERYPGVKQDCRAVIDELQPQSHHSQVPIIFFRAAVADTRILATVLREMSVDAVLPPIPTPAPSPAPDEAFAEILAEKEAKEKAKKEKKQKEQQQQERQKQELFARSRTPQANNRKDSAAINSNNNNGNNPLGGTTSSLQQQLGGGGSRPSSGDPNNPSQPKKVVVDVKHRRFRADEFMRSGQDVEDHPAEPNNPSWYQKNGVVWMTSDLTGPMTMT